LAFGAGEEPSGIALDARHHRLFAGCHNKMMVMLDTESGKGGGQCPDWAPVSTAVPSMTQRSSLSPPVAMGNNDDRKRRRRLQIDSGSSVENRTWRKNDGARPNNASDLSADKLNCSGAFAFARCFACASRASSPTH
jgi:hypothetical protein